MALVYGLTFLTRVKINETVQFGDNGDDNDNEIEFDEVDSSDDSDDANDIDGI